MNLEMDNLQNADGVEEIIQKDENNIAVQEVFLESNNDEDVLDKVSEIETIKTEESFLDTSIVNNEISLVENKSSTQTEDTNKIVEIEENIDHQNIHAEDVPEKEYSQFSMESIIEEMSYLLNNYAVFKISKSVSDLKNHFQQKIEEEKAEKKAIFLAEGGDELSFHFDNPLRFKFNEKYQEYKKQLNNYYKQQENQQQENLKKRLQLIEDLKALYQNVNDSNTNIFQKFRDIRLQWHNTGMVPKAQANDLYKTYYHHLDNFYEYLNLNKELREMDLAHNLENRYSIINRTKELLKEPNILKALNELQYLHKKWKESAVPVAEEHREKTWQEFKDLTNKIHERRNELTESLRVEQEKNLETKKEIIAKLRELNNSTENNHRFFQKNVQQVETLREQFFQIGRVPKEESNKTWNEFKTILKEFNVKKNQFYKDLKHSQSANLDAKNALLQTALDNKNSEDWELALDLFKKIQKDWRNIGHVPRKISDKIWNEFQDACNVFFERYKNRNTATNEEWEQNFVNKKAYLEEIREIELNSNKDKAFATLKEWNAKWNELGKVPKENISINKDFSELTNAKMAKIGIKGSDLKQMQSNMAVENIKASGDERKLNDEIIKIKKNISDLNQEIAQLENNLSFFSNAKSDNPLLKNVISEIERKKESLSLLKKQLHNMHHINLNLESKSEIKKDAINEIS